MNRNSITKKLVEKLDKIYSDIAKAKDFKLIGYDILATGPAIKKYDFQNFTSAVNFVSGIAEIADRFSTLPEVKVSNNSVQISVYDNNLQALTETDLHLAIAIDDAYNTLRVAKTLE